MALPNSIITNRTGHETFGTLAGTWSLMEPDSGHAAVTQEAEICDEIGSASQEVVTLDERAWLPRHCRGDVRAFAQLVGAYRAPVFGFLVRSGVDPAYRDDIFQEVFMKIHLAAASYEPARPLRPWVFTIVANTVRNHFRDEAGRRKRFTADEDLNPVDPGPNPEQQLEMGQREEALQAAIQKLPAAQREVLVLAALSGLSLAEVAEVVGAPINTVKTRLHRARFALAEEPRG